MLLHDAIIELFVCSVHDLNCFSTGGRGVNSISDVLKNGNAAQVGTRSAAFQNRGGKVGNGSSVHQTKVFRFFKEGAGNNALCRVRHVEHKRLSTAAIHGQAEGSFVSHDPPHR